MKSNAKKCKEKKERVEPPFLLVTTKAKRNYRDAFAAVAKLLEDRKNVLVLAGAGLSVSCGLPDFRSRGSGLYSKLDADVSCTNTLLLREQAHGSSHNLAHSPL